jgi:hypothetical protein
VARVGEILWNRWRSKGERQDRRSLHPLEEKFYDYTGRLMRALHFPKLVIPTHWDNFFALYAASQQLSVDALQSFVQEVKSASPNTKVVVPKYFEPIPLAPPN